MLQRIAFIFIVVVFSNSVFAKADTVKAFEQAVADHKGKVIYVDFWASWCIPCRKSFPWMNDMQRQYGGDNFTVISVNLDADKDKALNFLKETPANFAIIYDAKGKIAKKFKLKGMPSSFIINKAGEVVSAHVGFTDEKKVAYEKELLELIGQ